MMTYTQIIALKPGDRVAIFYDNTPPIELEVVEKSKPSGSTFVLPCIEVFSGKAHNPTEKDLFRMLPCPKPAKVKK